MSWGGGIGLFKKSFLSLAAISFLANYAQASTLSDDNQIEIIKYDAKNETDIKNSKSITGGGCSGDSCTISTTQNSGVTITGNGTLTITNGGSVTVNSTGNAITINGNGSGSNASVNIDNNGKVEGGGNGILIDNGTTGKATITNKGTILGSTWNGISLKENANVDSITNSGTITGNERGIYIQKNVKVDTITNSGNISAMQSEKGKTSVGIDIGQGSTVDKLENSGNIKGSIGISLSGATIKNLNNSGTIEGTNGADTGTISVKGGSSVSTLTNTGTIKGANSIFYSAVKYESIVNEKDGFIKANNVGIYIDSFYDNTSDGDLIENKGTIEAGNSGIFLVQATNTKNIKNSGVIKANDGIKLFDLGYGTSKSLSVENIENSGTILASQDGIVLTDQRKNDSVVSMSIGHISNSGTIQAGRHGINISDTKNAYSIGKIDISGQIIGESGAGLYIGAGQKLTQDITITGQGALLAGGQGGIVNNGIIGDESDPSKGGIKLNNGGQITSLQTQGDKLLFSTQGPAILNTGNGIIYGNTEISNGSQLIGGIHNQENASLIGDIKINGDKSQIIGGISNSGSGKIEGSIKLEDGGKVDSIVNDGQGSITGDISVGSGSSIDNIINNGDASIGGGITVDNGGKLDNITNSGNGNITGGIKNDGNLGSINNSGNIGGSIENNNGDLNIKNEGGGSIGGGITVGSGGGKTEISNDKGSSIGGGITNKGDSDISIDNKGDIGKNEDGNNITNDGNGNINIKDWELGSDKDGNLDKINVGGSGSGSTNIDNITIDTSDPNYDATKPINPGDIIADNTTGSGGGVGNIGNIGSNNDLIDYEYNPINGNYESKAKVAAGMGSIMAQTLINTYVMRSFFIDTVLDDAARMVERHSKLIHKNKDLTSFSADEHYHGFVLPYYSSNSIKLLNSTDKSKGNTTGIIAGFHTLRDIGMLGAYIGTEKADMDSGNFFNLKMKTIYGGLKYSKNLIESESKDVFLKAHTKVAFTNNDMKKYIQERSASGDTNTYGYGVSFGGGAHFYAKGTDRIITPELSLNYEGGTTKAFSMSGPAALSHERYYQSNTNLFSTTASLKWLEQWSPKFSTALEGGARINFNPDIESKVNFAGKRASEELHLPRTYQYVQTSLIYSLTKDFDVSINYNGTFSSNADSHTGYLQFDFIF